MEMINGEPRRRGKFRDYQRFDDADDEDINEESNGINPFLIVLLVATLTISLAVFISYSVIMNRPDMDSPSFDVTRLRSSEPGRAVIWSELGPVFDIIQETETVKVVEWDTNSYGRVRALIFTTSNGIEGIHKVNCIDDTVDCVGDWKLGDQVPALEYVHTMTMALIAFSAGNQCPQDTQTRILHIGLGSGTIPSYIEHTVPQWQQTIVEISTDVISVAPLFGINTGESLEIIHEDADMYFERKCSNTKHSAIMMDAFDPNDAIAACTANPDIIKYCLETDGVVIVNLVLSEEETIEKMLAIVHSYKKTFTNVILIESAHYHKTLIASDRQEIVSQEDFFHRTENLHSQCGLPLLTRGRGYWFDVSHSTDKELNEWFRVAQHSIRTCRGLNCLLF